jgi:two-component system, sensor histidine kinase PdtaS
MVSSLLNLQSNRVSDDAARTALRESISRLDSMAIIHQQLYGKSDFRTIRIDEYLKQLIAQIERGYGQGNHSVKINLDVQSIIFNLDLAIPIGIIMNEVITNCYKHAFVKKDTGTVYVSLKAKNGKTHLIISDDGDGLPSDFEVRRLNSLGQELIVLLVDQLGGQLKITSDKGTEYHIVF